MSYVRRARRAIADLSTPLDRLPIRIRLAAVSTALTFVILCSFALAVGDLTVRRIRSDFYRQVAASATDLRDNLRVDVDPVTRRATAATPLENFAGSEHAVVRVLATTTPHGYAFLQTPHAPDLGPLSDPSGNLIDAATVNGYRVVNRVGRVVITHQGLSPPDVVFQYARPLSEVEATVARVRLLLAVGVLAGTALALLAGVMIARRAMAPIARLTATAGEIARTGDPRRRVQATAADDEVSELARTFDEMLRSLDGARHETEQMLARQRQFVADASHELRTPLTSVLANLELLADALKGEQGEAAKSALRSSQRMRRLVADLLLLARTDVGRVVRRAPTDLARVLIDAAAELGPISAKYNIELDARPALVLGVYDDLLRLAINLMENAVRHTPPGSTVRVSSEITPQGDAQIVVEDDGPGIAPPLMPTLFERFVRGAGDRGGSFGLGLAIVRAVAEAHGGSVALAPTAAGSGARFVVRLPAEHVVSGEEPTGTRAAAPAHR